MKFTFTKYRKWFINFLMVITFCLYAFNNINASINQLNYKIQTNSQVSCGTKEERPDKPEGDIPSPINQRCMTACDSARAKYFTANSSGSNYQWSAGGNISITQNGNEAFITWGQAGTGYVKVVIIHPDGSKDSTSRCVEIVESPDADFYTQPADSNNTINACLNQPVNFYDNSTEAVSWEWDFGDGTHVNAQNPTHQYSNSGTYTVTLTVTNECNCTDTIQKEVVVDPSPAPEIECPSVVCANDTAEYSTPADCDNYNWTVNNGNIISASPDSSSIIVSWDDPPSGQGSVTLDIGNCQGYCSVPSTVNVPIIPTQAAIEGDSVVCLNDLEDYKVPKIPGTKYNWSVDNGANISGSNTEHEVSVQWPNTGTYTLSVEYYNNFLDCGGQSEIEVEVRPELYINGPQQLCANSFNTSQPFIAANSQQFINADWSVITPDGNWLNNLATNTSNFDNYDWSDGSGTYQVIAVNDQDNTCNDTASLMVTVSQAPPLPQITGDSVICHGSTHQYMAMPDSGSTTFHWMVTNGTITPPSQTGSNISVGWDNSGPYSLSVFQEMSNAPGCVSDTGFLSVDTIQDPIINGPDTVCPDQSAIYTATYHSELNYEWSITPAGAGSIVEGNGTDSVKIIWYNSAASASIHIDYPGCTGISSDFGSVTITPAASPAISQAGPLCENGQTTLSSTSADSSYTWTDSDNQLIGNSQSITITEGGNYNLEVTYSNGCSADTSLSVNELPAPDASISTPDDLVYCNSNTVPDVTFYAQDGNGYTFQWLKDGNLITGATDSVYTTDQTGNYSVIVTMGNCSDTSNTLHLKQINCNGSNCTTGETVSISVDSSCNPFGFSGNLSAGIGSYKWHFDDPQSAQNIVTNTLNPVHEFTHAGYFHVTLTGTASNNNPSSDSCGVKDKVVINVPLVAKFKSHGHCRGDSVNFEDLSTYTAGNDINSWSWNFGDPYSASNTSNQQSPAHVYDSTGTYQVTLTVSNDSCTQTYSDSITITGPDADFMPDPVPVCEGSPVTFDPSVNSGSPITGYNWNFDDGNTSSLESPDKTFTSSGNYQVSLYAVNSQGCSGSIDKNINVISPQPAGDIDTTGEIPVCEGDSVQLTAPSSSFYEWSTGDSTQSVYIDSAGDYHVTVKDANGCKVMTSPVSVQVTPKPDIDLNGPQDICVGNSITVTTGLNSNNYEFKWYKDGNFAGTAPSYSVFVSDTSASGTVSVEVTDTATNCTYSDSMNINVHPRPESPQISTNAPAPLCEGGPSTISVDNPVSTNSYVWSNEATGTQITVFTSGTYYVNATNQFGCSNRSNNVIIHPKPKVECVISGCYEFCDSIAPKTVTAPPGYASYEWYSIDTASNNYNLISTSQNLNIDSSGFYKVVITSSEGCKDTSDLLEINFVPCDEICKEVMVSSSQQPHPSDSLNEGCCRDIHIRNQYNDTTFSGIAIHSMGDAGIDLNQVDLNWNVNNLTDSTVTLMHSSGSIPLGWTNDLTNICLSGQSDSTNGIIISWLGQGADHDTLCKDTILFNCMPDKKCVEIVDDTLLCLNDSLTYSYYIRNNSDHVIESVQTHTYNTTGVTVNPEITDIPALAPGDTYGPVQVSLSGSGLVAGDTVCFKVSGHSNNTPENSEFCCTNNDVHCLEVPTLCEDCDSLDITPVNNGPSCCWNLAISNTSSQIVTGIKTTIPTGSNYDNINNATNSGWNVQYVSQNTLIWTHQSGTIPSQDTLPSFCVENGSAPYELEVEWMVQNAAGDPFVLCTDQLSLNCVSSCIGMLQDRVKCKYNGDRTYSFTVYNNYSDDIEKVELFQVSPSGSFDQTEFTGTVPVQSSASYNAGVNGNGGDTVCFRLKVYDRKDDGSLYNCCTSDSVYCIVLPECCVPGIKGPEVICKGETARLCAQTCCREAEVKWSNGSRDSCITVREPGQYIAEWQCRNKSYADTIQVSFGDTDSCRSLNVVDQMSSSSGNKLNVYPNPASSDKVTIDYKLIKTSKVNIQFYRTNGDQVKQAINETAISGKQYSHQVHIDGLKSGVYILELSTDNGLRLYRKVMVME